MISTILLSSCGGTRAVVTNRADSTTTTISITTSNPTTVDVSPDVNLSVTPNSK